MLNLLLASVAFLPQGPGTSTAPVVINEFSYDDGGTDDLEFVELYNRTNAPIDISGWLIRNPDATGPAYGPGTGVDPTYTIPPGTIIPAGGFLCFGPGATLLAQNLISIGTTNLFENDCEAIELIDLTNTVVDSVMYENGLGLFGPHPLEGDGIYGDLAVGGTAPTGQQAVPTSSIGRVFDGYDNNDNGRDFLCCIVPTPGASNLRQPGTLPYVETFDFGSNTALIGGWSPGWVGARYVDPTSINSQNFGVRPASPQGGLAMTTWDNTGGGNTVQLDVPPVSDIVVETYAYFEPLMAQVNPAPYTPSVPPVLLDNYNIGDGEWWALGVRGTAAANGNPPNLGGYFNTISLGVGTRYHFVTGIAWAHLRTPTSSQLFLVDFANGCRGGNPQDWTILAGPINIVQGVNDGWQRVRLHVQGNNVVANFGGTYGFDDGLRVAATTTTTGPGAIYIAYREAILYNNNGLAGCRPPQFDLMDVHVPTTSKVLLGTASPTTVGTPTIDTNGLAIVGTTGFAITGTGMIPFGAPNYAFCAVAMGFSSFPAGYPVGGAPATAMGYVLPILVANLGFADATGAVSFPFYLPTTTAYAGVNLVTQLIDFDPAMAFPAPIGLSQGMETLIGF